MASIANCNHQSSLNGADRLIVNTTSKKRFLDDTTSSAAKKRKKVSVSGVRLGLNMTMDKSSWFTDLPVMKTNRNYAHVQSRYNKQQATTVIDDWSKWDCTAAAAPIIDPNCDNSSIMQWTSFDSNLMPVAMGDKDSFLAKYTECPDEPLGEGKFGSVVKGIRLCDQLPVAIKKIKKSSVEDWASASGVTVPLEYCILNEVHKCKSAIHLIDAFDLGDDYTIVTDLIEGSCTLWQFLGLAALAVDSPYWGWCGTEGYKAPEIVDNLDKWDGKTADIFALGVVLKNMYRSSVYAAALPPTDFDYETKSTDSSSCRQLIEAMLQISPSDRPSIEKILRHPWLNDH